ncbi:MAG TPA: HEAT repeat domain-containing protein [Vicinamibacterales bacterium]|nr:HEAT repeat domain-containing protein [Vicinamibacterales bacterium]
MKKLVLAVLGLAMSASAIAAPAPDSKRLALAKDYIAEEQWTRAIAELQAVSADASDPNRDEALFWLAHSEYQVGDQAAALEAMARLERLFPRSRWVRPARSLRVEIAQRLRRDDVLWALAVPAPPAPPGAATPPAQPVVPWPTPPRAPPAPVVAPVAPPAAHRTPPPAPAAVPAPPGPGAVAPIATTPPPPGARRTWRPLMLPMTPTPEGLLPAGPYNFDTDLKIEALVGLLDTHSDRVIPLLREIALDQKNPNEARRAVFVLAQSNRPEARNTVVEAAKRGPDLVRIAAIRELGRFQEPAFTTTLVSIARAEPDSTVRDTAIFTLGRTGARVQLRGLYAQLPAASRFAVLTALFNAKDDDELIRIAATERDQRLRTRARAQLRLLATPKAIKFLTENP